ncbi:MAG TPA: 1,2-phenylacetyl-CoA epoxidase subunit PaaD [Marmoricola sp.]|nr:1,2-phenylacetyl-CoA epoxidase subunit PaaD [Marmoricola sp.]
MVRLRADLEAAREVVAEVVDPELPMVTLADLGVVRGVELEDDRVVVTLTPTYVACPATATMKADVRVALARAGFDDVEVRTVLAPAWSTDWISERGRQALAGHGIVPPGPVPLTLTTRPEPPRCPQCDSPETREVSRFGASPCTSFHVCSSCGEPFDKVKEL